MFYADYNATTPVLQGVREKMEPFLRDEFGNPSTPYPLGRRANKAIEEARERVSELVDAKPEQIVFVSGGTESVFQALCGVFLAKIKNKEAQTISCVTAPTEHRAVLSTFEFLTGAPFYGELSFCNISKTGALSFDELRTLIGPDSIASFSLANNETGITFPLFEISKLCKEQGALLHTDAVQAAGKMELSFSKLGVDFLSLSGHKIGAPKGIGALVVGQNSSWEPFLIGGGQESGRRGGTPPVSQIVGFGEACRLAKVRLKTDSVTSFSRDIFETELKKKIPEIVINSFTEERLPNTSSITISGISATELVSKLGERGVMISSGAACNSSHIKPSHVLRAMGFTTQACLSTLRVSFGPETTQDEALLLADILAVEVSLFREKTAEVIKERMNLH